jgi:hypothetical protein
MAFNLADPAWLAQAALEANLAPGALDDHRIDESPDLVLVPFHDADPQRDPDLVRGKARARRVEHGLGQIVEQPLDGSVHARDLLRLFAKHRVIESEDWSYGHEIDFTRDLVAPNRLKSQDPRRSSSLSLAEPGDAPAPAHLPSM